jgi:Tfp pilus assembly protein PilO
MNEKISGSSLERLVLTQLRNPIKLRIALYAVILASWYFGFYSPTSDQMAHTSAQSDRERKRIATARQIEQLRKVLAPVQDRVPAHSGPNELIQYVMAHVRPSPLKLIDLRPAKTEDLGPYDAIGLRLTFEGTYSDLDAFLTWVENDHRMMRVDSLKIDPHDTDSTRLNVQLDLLSLAEKAKNISAEKPASGGRTEAKP